MKTKFEEFIQDAEQRRVFEQESLAIEATELISTLMKKHQVTKAELASKIGRSKAYVTQLLSGGRNMTLHTFADLAFALGHRVELRTASLSKPVQAPEYKEPVRLSVVPRWRVPSLKWTEAPSEASVQQEFCHVA